VIVVFYLQRYVLTQLSYQIQSLKSGNLVFTKATYEIISVIESKLTTGQGGVSYILGHLTENKMQMRQKDLTSKAPLKLHFSWFDLSRGITTERTGMVGLYFAINLKSACDAFRKALQSQVEYREEKLIWTLIDP